LTKPGSRKRALLLLAGCLLLAWPARLAAQENLETVLTRMDKAAADFRTAQADFSWDQYQKVVDETDVQKGTIYFRRQSDKLQMAADITQPDRKYLLFAGSKVQLYQPKIDQVTVYDTGKNKSDVESFLVLGFGGRGHDLARTFDLKLAGAETVDGVGTMKLELIPKSARLRANFERILLWIDMARGVSVQQQFFEPSGNFRLVKYFHIQLNQKLDDDVFKLKTTHKTKYINPQD
jgi:outer membrane lipoprotein-sorting protein